MASGRTAGMVLGVVIASVIAMLFLAPLLDAVDNTTGEQSVTNESVTANVGEYVELGGYTLNDGTVTVWGYNDTVDSYETATEGSDYEVNLDPGEVTALSGSSLIDDGEEMKVSYDYQATDGTTTVIAGFIPTMAILLVFVVVAQKTMDIL